MSYSKQVTKRIAVRYSGTVSYGPSEHGGTKSYSGTAYEDVVVNINVDTSSFDTSTHNCGGQVDLLTGSVAATEAAQVASIKENSRKVGKTLINGFFKTVRSEISQQINELKNNVEATLLKLQSDARRCNDMMHQMEVDYNRKCEQYLKIFNDLDRELHNRIYNLDQPTFAFRTYADTLNNRLTESDMVPTASVSGGENARLDAQLSATLVKERTYDTLGKAARFLRVQKNTAETITSSIIESNEERFLFLPVCYMESADGSGSIARNLYSPEQLDANKVKLEETLRNQQWGTTTEESQNTIRRYFNEAVAQADNADKHSERVREQIIRLFNQ